MNDRGEVTVEKDKITEIIENFYRRLYDQSIPLSNQQGKNWDRQSGMWDPKSYKRQTRAENSADATEKLQSSRRGPDYERNAESWRRDSRENTSDTPEQMS